MKLAFPKNQKTIKDLTIGQKVTSKGINTLTPIIGLDNKTANAVLKRHIDKLKGVEVDSVILNDKHCVKSVRIWSYSGLYFPAFGLNTERYGVSFRIWSECGKMQTRITPNTDTLYAVKILSSRLKKDGLHLSN